MSIWDGPLSWLRSVADSFGSAVTGFNDSMTTLAGWLNSFVNAQVRFWTNPVAGVETGAAELAGLYHLALTSIVNLIHRTEAYIVAQDIAPFVSWVKRRFASEDAYIQNNFTVLWRLIINTNDQTVNWAQQQLAAERQARIQGDQLSEAYTRAQVKYALGLIQQAAASGYKATLRGQQDVILRLADDIATRDPLVKDLVSRIAGGILDLASIEDPILRIGLGFILREVIDRLGLDKVMGDLLSALLESVLGHPQPNNLHDVIMAIGTRLNALEGQWETFMANGGPEIFQAGNEWKAITGVLADIGLAAFFGTMVADPTAWANDIAIAAGPVVGAATTAFTDALSIWR